MTPREIIAATLWSEDRGGGAVCMEPIGGVILNRFEWPRVHGQPYWWSGSIGDLIDHCLHAGQFDGWCWHDNNFRPMHLVDETNPAFAAALEIADRMLSGASVNRAAGATHYFAKTMMAKPPDWYFFNPKTRTGVRSVDFETAHHLFFKIGPGA